MENLSFLPPHDQSRVRTARLLAHVRFWILWILVVAVAVGLFLGGGLWTVHQYTGALSSQLEALFSEEYLQTIVTREQEIQRANDILQHTDHIFLERFVVSSMVSNLADRQPNGIVFEALTFDRERGELRLIGRAQTREDVLAFEKMLRETSGVTVVDSPVSNILEARDIEFLFTVSYAQ